MKGDDGMTEQQCINCEYSIKYITSSPKSYMNEFVYCTLKDEDMHIDEYCDDFELKKGDVE